MKKNDLLGVERHLPPARPTTGYCEHCSNTFKYRKNKRFCDKNCTKAASRAADQKSNPSPSRSEVRRYAEVNDLAKRCAERYYTLPPNKREEYLLYVIRCGFECNQTRSALTSGHLVQPDLTTRSSLFWNSAPLNNLTIAEIANRYCKIYIKTDIFKLVKEKWLNEPKGVDMLMIDHRYIYKECQPAQTSSDKLDEKLKSRPDWVQSYFRKISDPNLSKAIADRNYNLEVKKREGELFQEMLEDEETMEKVHHARWLKKEEQSFSQLKKMFVSSEASTSLPWLKKMKHVLTQQNSSLPL